MGTHTFLRVGLVSVLVYCIPKHLAELRKPYELVGQEQRGDWVIDVFRDQQGNCSLHQYYVSGPNQDPFAEPLPSPTVWDIREILEKYDCNQQNIYK